MNKEKQVTDKIIDAFLLPAVASTLFAMIYLGYRWSKLYGRRKSLTILEETTHSGHKVKSATVFINYPKSCKVFNTDHSIIIEIQNKPSNSNIVKTTDIEEILFNVPEIKFTKESLKKCQCMNTKMFCNLIPFPLQICTTSDLQSECEPLWDYSDVIYSATDQGKLTELEYNTFRMRDTTKVIKDNVKDLQFTTSRVPELCDDVNSFTNSEQKFKASTVRNNFKDYLQLAFD